MFPDKEGYQYQGSNIIEEKKYTEQFAVYVALTSFDKFYFVPDRTEIKGHIV
jgi:hypothetical protein